MLELKELRHDCVDKWCLTRVGGRGIVEREVLGTVYL